MFNASGFSVKEQERDLRDREGRMNAHSPTGVYNFYQNSAPQDESNCPSDDDSFRPSETDRQRPLDSSMVIKLPDKNSMYMNDSVISNRIN